MLTVRIRASTNPCFPMKNFGIPITFDESSLRSNSSSPTSSYTPSFDSSVSEDFRFHQRSGSLVKWTFFVICMEYRDSVIQKYNSKEILSANEELVLIYIFPIKKKINKSFEIILMTNYVLKIACQQQDFRQRRTEIKNFLKNYLTDGVLEKIMHNILSTLTAIKAYFPKTTILRIHSHNYVDSIIKSFFPKAKKQLQTGQAGHQDHLLERRNDSILALLDQNLILPELMIYWKMLCHGSGIYRMALIGEFTFPKAQQLGETHGCFSGDGHSAGSREQGGQSFTQGRATQKNSQKLKIKNMMLSFSN
ncbi:unnamed protein product [Rhizophagus irregularis]|nr:unnamed protein product [Rhizophagus irregularis]